MLFTRLRPSLISPVSCRALRFMEVLARRATMALNIQESHVKTSLKLQNSCNISGIFAFVPLSSFGVRPFFCPASTPSWSFSCDFSFNPTHVPKLQNYFLRIRKTCLFNILLALTVVTLLFLTAAVTGIIFEIHETGKQCFCTGDANLFKKRTILSTDCISAATFWFPCVNTHEHFI